MHITSLIMAADDLRDYARLRYQLDCMTSALRRNPWRAKGLRPRMKAAAEQLAQIENRYPALMDETCAGN